ncbi:PREDICTED: chaperone protein dnaJ 10-like isoform X2 [Camelina sativa]|uniref:Chaperone protein dnaJ 10-like isoform X2 n=1 Tax=Camelina sativa TaxID=90675 RepID=A0ABM0UGD2_CAMSA|nr:PREDICTED: chaperone protein dnaJ 10-like isoform X2 [Camelina sativa]
MFLLRLIEFEAMATMGFFYFFGSEAYQVLSDYGKRQAYDACAKSGIFTDAIIDPAEIFAMLFGSELFEGYIGQLAMVSMASLDSFTEGNHKAPT